MMIDDVDHYHDGKQSEVLGYLPLVLHKEMGGKLEGAVNMKRVHRKGKNHTGIEDMIEDEEGGSEGDWPWKRLVYHCFL
jgi:hypothetical protein